jgi:glycosyltransferase involved in cell wall biosynthesis
MGSMSQDGLINFLNSKSFVIKSTTFDSFPSIILECMALGLIPIISDKIGTKDYINNEVNGFIYNSSSTEDLKNLLIKIHDNRFNLNNISSNAKKICEKLSWQNVSREYISAFKSVL